MYDEMTVKFELEDVDGRITKQFSVDDCESWTNIMLKCADFLSAQYGYGIAEKVLFISDYPSGRDIDYTISKNEFKMILQHRKREQAIDSLFDDEEDTQ
jgi:hypothetical protein